MQIERFSLASIKGRDNEWLSVHIESDVGEEAGVQDLAHGFKLV
jgi:hypothetical protein